jgi:hypothetical protein
MCINATARAQTGSSALPDCRGYEMVSPSYKEGFAIEPAGFGFTEDGMVSYQSFGSFAGNPQGPAVKPYHATRSVAGWMTTALSPLDQLYDTRGDTVVAESVDLRRSLWRMSRRDLPGDKVGFYLRDLDGVLTRIGDAEDDGLGGRIAAGGSADLSHIVFNHGAQGAGKTDLYEYVGTNNGSLARAVSVDNHGQQTPVESCLNDVSADGRVIVYTAGCNSDGGATQVWARVAGTASVAVSGSECTRTAGDADGACNGVSSAEYAGGAADGSRVIFTTHQQLVNSDTDTANDVYACDMPAGAPAPVGSANLCASLTRVSGTASNAQVENVVTVSEDGSRVYFVAQGVLANNLGVGDVGPVAGAHNLYMWERDGAHSAGETRFVVSLLGAAGNDVGRAQITPDNRYLLFLTASKLVGEGPGADNDDAVDAYRYDTVTRSMARVSTSVSGSGGDLAFDVSLARLSSMTADGSTVIFNSAEALAGSDMDGVTDVYGWHDGHVSLISAGGGNAMAISPVGRDIFFFTGAQVLAIDGDANTDLYDARVDGGFTVGQTPPCSGDVCQGQQSRPPSLTVPRAPVLRSGGLTETPPAFSLRAMSAAQRKALAATGKFTLTVTTNVPGTISVKATAAIGGRAVTVGSGRRTLAAPGRVAVALSLSKRARRQLVARGRLTVRIVVSHSKVALDRSVTLRLVRTKAKARRSAQRGSAVGMGGGRS